MNSSIYKALLVSLGLLYSITSSSMQMDVMIAQWKQKNYLILTIPVKFDKLEPTISLNAHTKLSLPLIYEPLVSIAAQRELQPVLAQSWLISSDNKSITITIKKNHYFSDHTEVTAQDVVNTMHRLCSPTSKVFSEIKGLAGCEEHAKGTKTEPEVKTISKYTVTFNINCSPTNFLYQLSSPSVVITKQHHAKLIGSGPYVIFDAKPTYLVLNKNPYSSSDNIAKNNGLVILYANQNILSMMLNNGKSDASIMYRIQDIWNIHNSRYKLITTNPNITEILVLNNQRYPFNLPIVRKALQSTIYNNFIETCIPGAHKAYGVIPFGTGGSISNITPKLLPTIPPSDVFRSAPSLKANQANVIIHQLNDLKNSCESQLIKNAAKKYNINITFKYHQDYSTLEPLYINHQLDGFIELYVFRNREAYSMLQFFTKNGENNANINDSRIDDMLKEAIKNLSSHKRYQAYKKVAEFMQNESIVIPLYYMDHGNLLSKCIRNTSDNFISNPFSQIPQLYKTNKCDI